MTTAEEPTSTPVPFEKPLPTLPQSALTRFGCVHCEFRMTPSCPVYKPDLDDLSTPTELIYPKEGYCAYRVRWLSSFLPDYGDTVPTASQVMLDLLKGLGHKRHLKDAYLLVRLEQDLAKLEGEDIPYDEIEKSEHYKKLKYMRNRLNELRATVDLTWKELMKVEDRQVDRETVRKSETTLRQISPTDIAEMIEASYRISDEQDDSGDGDDGGGDDN